MKRVGLWYMESKHCGLMAIFVIPFFRSDLGGKE
jgi:hypothetical protein